VIKKYFYLLVIAITILVLSPTSASADLGPKPTTNIEVVYNQQRIADTNFDGKILTCVTKERMQYQADYWKNESRVILNVQYSINNYDKEDNCYWFPEIDVWGNQYGGCTNSLCRYGSMSVRPGMDDMSSDVKEFKFAVFIPSLNKFFVTNKISRKNFNSEYRVALFSDGSAVISETTPILSSDKVTSFVLAFFITIILELLVALIFVSIKNIPKKLLVFVLLANVITLPMVWFLFPLINATGPIVIILSEVFAVSFEAFFFYIFGRQIISLKQSMILSVVNNSVSLFIGGFIYFVVAFIFEIHM